MKLRHWTLALMAVAVLAFPKEHLITKTLAVALACVVLYDLRLAGIVSRLRVDQDVRAKEERLRSLNPHKWGGGAKAGDLTPTASKGKEDAKEAGEELYRKLLACILEHATTGEEYVAKLDMIDEALTLLGSHHYFIIAGSIGRRKAAKLVRLTAVLHLRRMHLGLDPDSKGD